MLKLEQKFGLSGEFRVIVRRADGSIKVDTGMQPNLVLDNGIKHYLGLPMLNDKGVLQTTHKNGFMNACVVGSGNNPPQNSDVSLQNFVAKNVSTRDKTYGKEEPTDNNHNGFVKVWQQQKYVFDKINNQNITEVGLCAWYGSESINSVPYNNSYTLVTRALCKDSSGSPIAITVLAGEILEVIYRINMYVDIKRKKGTFNVTTSANNKDVTETFDYFLQPYDISTGEHLTYSLSIPSYYNGTWSVGVKEKDTELDKTYDIDSVDYRSITHNSISKINSLTVGSKTTTNNDTNKSIDSYMATETVRNDFESKTQERKRIHGVYAHVHPNGIRAYNFSVGYLNYTPLVKGLVVVKNQANGQGIKKTNRQMWEFSCSYTIDRWSE